MSVTIVKEKYPSKLGEVVLGATSDQGGTRTSTVTVGGESTLPYLHFEGKMPNKPAIAMEVNDIPPTWSEALTKQYGDVFSSPAAWAKKCVEFGADLIYLKFDGADPEGLNRSPEDCANVLKEVLAAVGVPIIVEGCGDTAKDNEVMAAVAEAGAGENLLLGVAEQDNYKSLTAAAMVHKHTVIARTPLDINICKQLNILINEMGLPLNKIVLDPTVAGLGFGIEYVYSIMERARLGALGNDKMLSMPYLCNVGFEANRSKEATMSNADAPQWGDLDERNVTWEAISASTCLQVGAAILLMRNPIAVAITKKNIDELMVV